MSRRPKPRTMETPIGLAPITCSGETEPVLRVKLRRRIEGPGKTAKHELAQDPGGGEDIPRCLKNIRLKIGTGAPIPLTDPGAVRFTGGKSLGPISLSVFNTQRPLSTVHDPLWFTLRCGMRLIGPRRGRFAKRRKRQTMPLYGCAEGNARFPHGWRLNPGRGHISPTTRR